MSLCNEGALEGLGNEIVGAGKFAYGMTVGLGEQISLTGMDIVEANYGGTDFQSGIFRGAFNMMLDGATTGDMLTEVGLQVSGFRFGNQIYADFGYGTETGDYSQFSQDMGMFAGIVGGLSLGLEAGEGTTARTFYSVQSEVDAARLTRSTTSIPTEG